MNVEELRDYCLLKPGATEGFPFGEDTLVFKVGGKLFLLTGLEAGNSFNVKCDPELAVELRERYSEVIPGYHMNKTHWNSVVCEGLRKELILELIDQSYELIFNSLTKKKREEVSNS